MTGPWISGESLSPSRLNVHGGSATLATGFSTNTLQPESGLTVNFLSDVSIQNTVAAQRLELGGAPSNTSGLVSLRANSAQTDYLFLQDATGIKSNFLLGLRTGDSNASLVDGLNLYDASDNTMIVRFSSDSVRFYPPIIAPVFDTGGALAGTYNAALYVRGGSKESQIQAAITAAAGDGIPRVYVPSNLYPYSAASVSFDTRVQMVREGGNWAVHDVVAYGANILGTTDATRAIQSTISNVFGAGGGVAFLPVGKFAVSSTITIHNTVSLIGSGASSVLSSIASYTHMLDIDATTALGNRYGVVEKLALRGGSRTSIGFHVGGAVQRAFRDISIESFSDCGLVVNSTQNCLFERIDTEFNGGNSAYASGIRLNHGAGNNVFSSCEIDQNGGCGVLFVQNDISDRTTVLNGFTVPAANKFIGCQIERQVPSSLTLISIFSGRRNTFLNCDLSNTSLNYTVYLDANAGGSNIFDSCYFAGSASVVTAMRNAGFYTRVQNCFFETHLAGIETSQRMLITGDNIFTNSGASVTNLSGNAIFNLRSFDGSGAHVWLNQGRLLSVRTAASLNSTSLEVDEMAFAFNSSMGSLAIRSGGTVWFFSSSNSTKG